MKNKSYENISIHKGDITLLEVDAIVNAANKSLLGGGGVDGAIHKAAGKELLKECRKLGGCNTGDAKLTGGYNLKAKFVIHTVGPVYSGRDEDEFLLASCYRNCLNIAVEHGVTSIAFPAISCGVYGYPIEKASETAITEALKFLDNSNTSVKVIFVLFSKIDYDIYMGVLKGLKC